MFDLAKNQNNIMSYWDRYRRFRAIWCFNLITGRSRRARDVHVHPFMGTWHLTTEDKDNIRIVKNDKNDQYFAHVTETV